MSPLKLTLVNFQVAQTEGASTMDKSCSFDSLSTPRIEALRKPWRAPQVIVAEGRETDHNIPFGGTPDGSLTSINYAYGS